MNKIPTPLKVILAVVAIVLLAMLLSSVSRDRTPSVDNPKPSIPSRSQAIAPTLPPTAPPAPAGPLTTFGDGVWEVGVDIAPGKYKTSGPDGRNCYYSRLQENDGSLSDILDNGNSDGPVTVTIKDDDGYFESRGCNDWILQ